MDPIDQKIVSILKYGKKKPVEIVTLLDNEASERTIRRHLDDLENDGEITREENSGMFYLPTQKDKLVRPKPFADQEKVDQLLFNIKSEFETIQSEAREYHGGSELQNRTTNVDIFNGYDTNLGKTERGGDILEYVSEFYDICAGRHYVLKARENLNNYFKSFDLSLDIIELAGSENTVLVPLNEIFELFFMSANNLYDNWYDGKEHKEFDTRMTDRSDRILSIFEDSDPGTHPDLRSLLTNIGQEEGQAAYISMVKSGNYDQDRLLEDAFYTYDVNNDLHKLFNDIDKARQQVDDEKTAQNITDLKEEIIRLYTREVQDIEE